MSKLLAQNSYFNPNSFWSLNHNAVMDNLILPRESRVSTEEKPCPIPVKRMEDWIYRLLQCANEAEDEGLLALQSDIFDIRDEIAVDLAANR